MWPSYSRSLGVIGIIPCIIMTVWTSNPASVTLSAAYASYFISYMALGTAPLIFAWLSDLYAPYKSEHCSPED
jgi:hypothetical protein